MHFLNRSYRTFNSAFVYILEDNYALVVAYQNKQYYFFSYNPPLKGGYAPPKAQQIPRHITSSHASLSLFKDEFQLTFP